MGTDIHGVFQAKKENEWVDIPSKYEQDRHYSLFAWLGNVRNGYGFAGVETHTQLEPLSDCRGLPSDFLLIDGDSHPIESIDIMDVSRQKWHEDNEPLEIWMGDHSYSWVTAEEILNTSPPKIVRSGIVKKEIFDTWDGKSAPESWCGGISGKDILVSNADEITDMTTHVRIKWDSDTADEFGYFIDEIKRLSDEYGEIRFVFGFDS